MLKTKWLYKILYALVVTKLHDHSIFIKHYKIKLLYCSTQTQYSWEVLHSKCEHRTNQLIPAVTCLQSNTYTSASGRSRHFWWGEGLMASVEGGSTSPYIWCMGAFAVSLCPRWGLFRGRIKPLKPTKFYYYGTTFMLKFWNFAFSILLPPWINDNRKVETSSSSWIRRLVIYMRTSAITPLRCKSALSGPEDILKLQFNSIFRVA